jgi:uncharacterized delta-60 repeat protein
MIAGGFDGKGEITDFAVARYLNDGSLDPTFGDGDGFTTTDFGGTNTFDFARATIVTPDDGILLGGSAGADFAVARYLPGGRLDERFGTGGSVTTDIDGQMDAIRSLLFQQKSGQKRIVAFGYSVVDGQASFSLARYRLDGTLDTSFGVNGIQITDMGGSDQGRGAALTQGGKIVAVGYTKEGQGVQDFAIAQYKANGTLDTTFGIGGKVLIDNQDQGDVARDVKIQPDGKIVVCGYSGAGGGFPEGQDKGPGDFMAVRLNPDGSMDTSFGDGDGIALADPGGSDHARACVLQADGKIVLSGNSWSDNDDKFATARLNPDGSLDTSFGGTGIVITDFGPGGGDEHACDVRIQADGKIIAAGPKTADGAPDWALVRYLS